MKKKRYEIIVIIVLMIISMILLMGYVCSKFTDDESKVNKYSADVSFTIQNSEDKTIKSMVSYKYDGKSIIAKPDYLKGSLYIDRGIVYVSEIPAITVSSPITMINSTNVKPLLSFLLFIFTPILSIKIS